MADLSQFMLNLAKSPAAAAAFRQNPQAAMTQAGLSTGDVNTVLSKNPALILKAVSASATEDIGALGLEARDVTVVVIVTPL